ncbi:TauD/TfdA dioxygenase family protein [Streptomyces sp. NRRL S-448]|uniref:TauD/TfdA dioxygenase family protein n=1 Tax=Streptomyces sp. NRRL S-448 TaxID=1463907 RepID=UPI003568F687
MLSALRPLRADGFGAVLDTDLTDPRTLGLAAELKEALHRHRVLVVPGQHLNHADLLAIAACFGEVDTDVDRRYAVGGFPGLTTISNILEDGHRVGVYDGDSEEEWHADNCFKPNLTGVTLLYSVIAPNQGGQTRIADATTAYAALPADVRQRIEKLRAVHSIQHLATLQNQASGQSSVAVGTLALQPEVEHPLVLTHPATRARSLLLGSMAVRHVVGLASQESSSLLAELLAHATSPRYVYSHRWKAGDLLVWDNRAVLHTASPCDSSRNQRLLYRAAVR